MYNEDRKQRFYQYKLNTVQNLMPIEVKIKRAAQFENIYKKDLCDFTFDEISEMYKLMSFKSIEALNVMNSVLNQYTNWCLSEHLVQNGQNIYDTFSSSSLTNLLNKRVIENQIVSRDELLEWTKRFRNPRDQFVFLSLFEFGKSKNFENIIYARLEDIDESNKTIKLYSNNHIVKISDQLIAYAKASNVVEEVTFPYKKIKLVDDGTIIKRSDRTVDTPYNLGRAVYNNIVKLLKEMGASTTADKIAASGQIHMINEEAARRGISGEKLLSDNSFLKALSYQYSIKFIRSNFMKKYGDYLV